MNYELIVRIFLDVSIIFLGLYLIFWRGYFTEKGKNYATREDIEEITQKIETVKNEIGFHSQQKMSYLIEKKKAALDFLNSISIWLDFTLRPLDILYNNPIDLKILSNIIADLKSKGAIATTAFWSLFVYYENEKFNDIVDKLYHCCLDLHNLTNVFLINLERKAIEANRKLEIYDLVKDRDQKKEINEELAEIHKDVNDLVAKYVKEKEELDEKAKLSRYGYILVLNKMFKIKAPNQSSDTNII